jgi:predicted MPP superfamily phosphohydrolase
MKWLFKQIKLIISFLTLVIIVLGTLYYGRYIEPQSLITKEYRIKENNIPESMNGMKIVHFSDIHYGYYKNEEELEKIVESINELNPEIIIFTGDLFDDFSAMTKSDFETVTKHLSNLKAIYGKYAIYGNHDYFNMYDNTNYFEKVMDDSGFTLLKNESMNVYISENDFIQIVGYDDVLWGKPSFDDSTLTNTYTVGLVHEPDYVDSMKLTHYDLVLSGHSHGGQISIPFFGGIIYPPGAKNYNDEYYDLNGTDLYISHGIGMTKIPIRLFTKPSINLYRFGKE